MKPLLAIAALLFVLPAAAEVTPKDSLLKHWTTSGNFTYAVADAMPAADYSFRPVPEEMSFGDLIVHIAVADRGACAVASGLTAPPLPVKIEAWTKDEKNQQVDKATAMQYLRDTFEFCNKAITQMPADRMNTVVGNPARNLTGAEWLWAYFTHTAHHRGQAEVYLRLKGIKPPDYRF